MKCSMLLVASLLMGATGALAQSTLTLDNFALDGAESEKSVAGDMEACLLDSAKCENKELKSSSRFSIKDVVNLGIIDRKDVKNVANSDASETAKTLPSIDIEIVFDYNSDAVRPDQFAKLTDLANILKGKNFSGYRFAFLGHTDAKGTAAYNQDLSRRRAETVSSFVMQAADFSSSQVMASGLGASQLKTVADPFGPANRRVQVLLIPIQ